MFTKRIGVLMGILTGVVAVLGAPIIAFNYITTAVIHETDLLYVSSRDYDEQTASEIIKEYDDNASFLRLQLRHDRDYWASLLRDAQTDLHRLEMRAEYMLEERDTLTPSLESELIFARELVSKYRDQLSRAVNAMGSTALGAPAI